MQNNEFYIGWQPKAPDGFSKHTRKVIVILLVAVTGAGIMLAVFQKKFATGNFGFGKLTEVKGIYSDQPVPMLKAINGKDIFGNAAYITIPLIGFGKFGADGVMNELEKEKGTLLSGRELTLKGTLLYNDGKLLMQIDSNDKPLVNVGGNIDADTDEKDLGAMTIKGEIVDPKCYFGVMKPGQGKPHKDCAIRCILGGIPPVLKVTDENGRDNYYLITGENGEKMNESVKDFVAEPVSVTARAVRHDDWVILYTREENISPVSKRDIVTGSGVAIACLTSCTK
ncbi:MAG: hypothetical protein SFU87_14400 [Chitinophagaceae bacterium]|nr:hypothetical protein [Chitinophagaceae bacterium]